jgi:hypothetical protein
MSAGAALLGCGMGVLCLVVCTALGGLLPIVILAGASSFFDVPKSLDELGGTLVLLGMMVGTLVGLLVARWVVLLFGKRHTREESAVSAEETVE